MSKEGPRPSTDGEAKFTGENHLYWPQLDVDLSVEPLRNHDAFPLVSTGDA